MLHPQQTFESFIPGAANQFGHCAAKSFADGQQTDIPLLYIHGGFGFGKTHLLNAAALEFRKRGKRTLFLRAEDFMRHFLGALYRKDTLAFKEELRTAEVLIIDDLQHICRSAATASEFLYTVNAFADLRRRVVIAADRAPQALEGLGADVKSRLAGGLCVGLDKPDRDTRLAILKSRAAEFTRHKPDVVLPDSVLERIADMDDAIPARADRRLHQAGHLCRPHQEAGDPGNGRGSGGPARRARRQDLDRGHPEEDGGILQAGREGLPFAPARAPRRPAAPGGDVSVAQADHPLPARDRAALRRAATTPRCCMPAAGSRR